MADVVAPYEDWISDAAWDTVLIGNVFLPGICTVEGLEVGLDIDVQKRKKKEKAHIRDNGLSPCAFEIIVELTAAQWKDWVAILPTILPKEGGVRTPLAITHPIVNVNGINDIYIHKIRYDAPSARKGMKIVIKVAEWFEEEKDTNSSKKVTSGPPNKFVTKVGDVIGAAARRFAENAAGFGPGALDNETVRNSLFPANSAGNNLFGDE